MKQHRWHFHPHVRSGNELSAGERAADLMRNGMGSWFFVFGALAFLGLWIAIALLRVLPIDNPQLTILNLILSCVAALQGAILLIAAKRADQVSAEMAKYHLEISEFMKSLLETNTNLTTEIHQSIAQSREKVTKKGV